ncbi:MAG: DNA topoisomerase I [Candidatus Taylorbacteria bacterium RIFCSPLOWO2_12_FULL_47_20]|uniref:DNA topoisomerase 1 n=2 Tax=Candidatus Tayloriibacteriota TaxID=1817919 RepID=A0A1G2P9G4_9BACT|nr:MAG: DNA topoisomerase I [Candidatus Taylorbacteria bacterium RIFCSPLOWO2_02_FULL_46_40]OHA44292.1 MAG: DNA topoisomerase I [Candidatus Taylorbacteria bacterium RIFCSPLOWO2_12_FULL_47_20]
MVNKLLIVESPSKAKTISKYLGGKYTVRASVGHIRDLPKSNKKAIDIEGGFKPHYEIVKGKEKIVIELKDLAEKADEVILATDLDREGEAIAWHLSQLLDIPASKAQRITYSEITKSAIEDALTRPRKIDQNLRRAQEARRVLDRLVGYDLSGLIWKKVRYGLSAGRVQSPALRILVEREREIKAFIPEKYWAITALTKTPKEEDLALTCEEEPRDEGVKNSIIKEAQSNQWAVKSVEETQTKRSPKPPFITSSLQQAASTRLGFSPGRTMSVAQKLYEAGLITYMRTDSMALSDMAKNQISAVVSDKFGRENLTTRDWKTKSKNAQEAHEAIRPTDFSKGKAGLTSDQKSLYELIWSRTIASQMTDAQILRTKITAMVGENKTPDFSANGSRVLSLGWLLADPEARGEEVELPKVAEKEKLTFISANAEAKETQPPSRYTEAGLIKELEKREIGRPSTYASIIDTIVKRGYVEKIGRALKPTDVGEVVSTFLEQNFTDYISDTFTAEMENELDDIASGKRDYEKTLKDFYTPFSKTVKDKGKTAAKITNLGDAPAEFKCPACGGAMVIKLSRDGKFLSCKKYPDCMGSLTMEGKEIKPDEPIGNDPKTNLPIFIKIGRFGPYVQLGEKIKGGPKPKSASLPKGIDVEKITLEDAIKYISLPRELGAHPKTGKPIVAAIGRFGPYIMHDGDFRSLKAPLNVFDIIFEQALEIILKPKETRRRFGKTPKKSGASA